MVDLDVRSLKVGDEVGIVFNRNAIVGTVTKMFITQAVVEYRIGGVVNTARFSRNTGVKVGGTRGSPHIPYLVTPQDALSRRIAFQNDRRQANAHQIEIFMVHLLGACDVSEEMRRYADIIEFRHMPNQVVP